MKTGRKTGELLITTNDRMPSDVTQIHEYNELIFGAAGDRLIYSDLQKRCYCAVGVSTCQ